MPRGGRCGSKRGTKALPTSKNIKRATKAKTAPPQPTTEELRMRREATATRLGAKSQRRATNKRQRAKGATRKGFMSP